MNRSYSLPPRIRSIGCEVCISEWITEQCTRSRPARATAAQATRLAQRAGRDTDNRLPRRVTGRSRWELAPQTCRPFLMPCQRWLSNLGWSRLGNVEKVARRVDVEASFEVQEVPVARHQSRVPGGG